MSFIVVLNGLKKNRTVGNSLRCLRQFLVRCQFWAHEKWIEITTVITRNVFSQKENKKLRIYFVYPIRKMIERIKWNERSNSFNFDLDGIEGGSGREWVGWGKWVRGASRRTRGEFRKPWRACSRVGHPKAVVCFLRMLLRSFRLQKFPLKKRVLCGSWIVTSSCPVSGKKHCRLVVVSHERKNVTSSLHMDNSEERGVRWKILEQQSVGDRLEFCRLCLHFPSLVTAFQGSPIIIKP